MEKSQYSIYNIAQEFHKYAYMLIETVSKC